MKTVKKIFFTLIIPLILFAQEPPNEEFRATWVITWNAYSSSMTTEQLKARTRQILDRHKEANMNAVLWQVRQEGSSYYDSPYEPWGSYLGYKDPGYDPLQYAIEEAHKRGLEIHAWFNAFHTSSTRPGTPAAEYSEWICRDQDGNPMTSNLCLSPGLEAVREYTRNVAMDIVNRYDIDGLHFDYIRWNEYSSSKSGEEWMRIVRENELPDGTRPPEHILRDLTENKGGRYLYDVDHPYSGGVPSGYTSWENFWRGSTDAFVEMVADSVKKVKPWVRVSVAALGNYKTGGWTGYYTVFQDAAKWFNEGWVDQLTPMHYHWTDASGFYYALSTDWEPNIQTGIEAGRVYSVGPGSYNFGTNWKNHPSIVNTLRTLPWVDGFQFFSYGSWADQQYWNEAGQTFFSHQTRMKPMTFINSESPTMVPQTTIVNEGNLYRITVSPPEGVTDPHWIVLYRTGAESIDPDTDDIIAMSFGTDPLVVTEYFDGTQSFAGIYGYYGILYSRTWNPSVASDRAYTHEIVSYPPVVLSSSVEDGSFVRVNVKIELEFSKRMDPDVFADKLIIEPETPAKVITWDRLNWKSGGRKVTVAFDTHLAHGVTYTFTLPGDLTDEIGLALDGNGDGTGGDPWSVSFTTDDRDADPPVLVDVMPDRDPAEIDITEAFTLRFNELVDPTTVGPDRIVMTTDGMPITPDAFLTTWNDKSVLNIRPYSRPVSGAAISLTLPAGVADTAGNTIDEPLTFSFTTKNYYYHEQTMIEDFMGLGDWRAPTYSGSTKGVVGSLSSFEKSVSDNFLPGSSMDPAKRRGGRLIYTWDMESSEGWFLRQHIAGGPPTQVSIDTSWTFQAFVYGDSSMNLIRFSLYETGGDATAEVSLWDTLNWVGWKRMEWNLWDQSQTGEWGGVGLGTMDGTSYRLESIQLTRTDSSAVSGTIWIDDIRIVKRTPGQAPANQPPVVESLPDTSLEQGKRLRIFVNFTDPNAEDIHQIICESDTSDITFNISGHTAGSRVYINAASTFSGESLIRIIVKDFGIGEFSDTTEFLLTVTQVVSVEDLDIPAVFALHGNYPNPFNPVTTIRYEIPEYNRVTLSLYDIRGSHITDLVDGHFPAGRYETIFDGSRYASGIYLIRLRSGAQQTVSRMVLLK